MTTERAEHWTRHETERVRLFSLIKPVIVREAKFQATRYGLPKGSADEVASRTMLKLAEKMSHNPPRPPFDAPTVERAVEQAEERFTVRELARQAARLDRRGWGRRSLSLDGLSEPTMPPNVQARIFECLEHVFRNMDEVQLTKGEHDVFVRETARRIDMEELDEYSFTELANLAGVTAGAIHDHIAIYNRTGRLSDRDRRAWSRAAHKLGAHLTVLGLSDVRHVALCCP